jgi:hypothetical protein
MMHTQKNTKQEQSKPKSKTREIIKNRAKINDIETKITIQRINETKSCLFDQINKFDTPLVNRKNGGEKRPRLIKSEMKNGMQPQIIM